MADAAEAVGAAGPALVAADPAPRIEALRAQGAARFEPVRFRFIEALARRAAASPDDVRERLETRLGDEIAAFSERFERARSTARAALAAALPRFPDAGEELQRCCDEGDFDGLRRRLATLEPRDEESPLGGLLAEIRRRTCEDFDAAPRAFSVTEEDRPDELKSLKYFRRSFTKLSVERQLSDAFAQAPENAGPLNSHFLVLRSLELMRELAPDYLEQFISYADALLWLEQVDSAARTPGKKPAARGERGRTRKAAGNPST